MVNGNTCSPICKNGVAFSHDREGRIRVEIVTWFRVYGSPPVIGGLAAELEGFGIAFQDLAKNDTGGLDHRVPVVKA
jgi:hypothetical protein